MNKEEPLRDQAERLRKRISKREDYSEVQQVSDLPPRSRVHQNTKKKTNWKLKYPLIRILALFFILLPLLSFSIYSINENKKNQHAEPVSQDLENFELIDFEEEEATEPEKDTTTNESDAIADAEQGEKEQASELSESAEPVLTPSVPNEKSTANEKDVQEKEIKEIIYHKVQENETLYRIAMRYYKSPTGIDKIKRANGIQDNEILVGQKLKIPME